MILSQALAVLGGALVVASPVVRLHEGLEDAVGSPFGIRDVHEARDGNAQHTTAAAGKPTKGPSPVMGDDPEPEPGAGALDVGWVTPGGEAFINMAIYHHNVHRANHTAPAVKWNDTLYQWAQKKADICQYNEDPLPTWDLDVGMNIAGGTYGYPKREPNPSSMISGLWYNSEEMNYPRYGVGNPNYNNFESWGHFSQVVWPTSHQIGCGLQNCGDSWFGLCLYYPPGNWDGEFNIIGKPVGYPPVYPNGQTSM